MISESTRLVDYATEGAQVDSDQDRSAPARGSTSGVSSTSRESASDASCINVAGINIAWQPDSGTCTFEKLPVAMMWVDTTLAGLFSGVQAMVGTERYLLALQSEGRKSVEADWQVIAQH